MPFSQYSEIVPVAPDARGAVGFVIGKKGANLSYIRSESGVSWIKYEQPKSQFVVEGSPKSVATARTMIRESLARGLAREDEFAERRANYWSAHRKSSERAPVPSKADFPAMKRVPSGFGALSGLKGKTWAEHNTEKTLAEEVERERREKEDQQLEAAWVSNSKLGDLNKKLDSQMEKADAEFAKRQAKFAKFQPAGKKSDMEGVWGNLSSKVKAPKAAPKAAPTKPKTVDITAAVLTSGGVDLVALKKHNRAVSAAEQAAWKAKKESWDAKNAARAAAKKQRESTPTVGEVVVSEPERPLTPAQKSNMARTARRQHAREIQAYYDEEDARQARSLEAAKHALDAGSVETPPASVEPVRSKSGMDAMRITSADEDAMDQFLANLPSGWGVAA